MNASAVILVTDGLKPCGMSNTARPGLDLQLHAGEIAVLTGVDEREKSHWLKTLAGLEPPAAGRLDFPGHAATERPRQSAGIRTHVGYVNRDAPLLSTLNIRANVALPRVYRLDEAFDRSLEAADSRLDRLRFSGNRHAYPVDLDPYEKMQALLARALALEPRILFLHEPFALSYLVNWKAFGDALASIARQERIAVLAATQNLAFAKAHADYLIHVDDGTVQCLAGWQAFSSSRDNKVIDFLKTTPFDPGEVVHG